MISTILGDIDEKYLDRKVVREDDGLKEIRAVEYYLAGRLVHRSAHITLKDFSGLDTLLGAIR